MILLNLLSLSLMCLASKCELRLWGRTYTASILCWERGPILVCIGQILQMMLENAFLPFLQFYRFSRNIRHYIFVFIFSIFFSLLFTVLIFDAIIFVMQVSNFLFSFNLSLVSEVRWDTDGNYPKCSTYIIIIKKTFLLTFYDLVKHTTYLDDQVMTF